MYTSLIWLDKLPQICIYFRLLLVIVQYFFAISFSGVRIITMLFFRKWVVWRDVIIFFQCRNFRKIISIVLLSPHRYSSRFFGRDIIVSSWDAWWHVKSDWKWRCTYTKDVRPIVRISPIQDIMFCSCIGNSKNRNRASKRSSSLVLYRKSLFSYKYWTHS